MAYGRSQDNAHDNNQIARNEFAALARRARELGCGYIADEITNRIDINTSSARAVRNASNDLVKRAKRLKYHLRQQ